MFCCHVSIVAIILLSAGIQIATADIRVSPVAIYLSDVDRHDRISVGNTGPGTKVVDIEVLFGYPVSDADGRASFCFVDSPDPREPSAAGWVSVFPSSFTLPAGECQTVVIMCDPPAGIADGEYWARPVLTFREQSSSESGNAEKQLALSVNYRHGSVTTGINLEGVTIERGNETTSVKVDLLRTGNAAYLGNISCRLIAPDGRVMGRDSSEVAVYHSLRKRFDFDLKAGMAADIVVETELNTHRQGNDPGDILQATSLKRVEEFVVISEEPHGRFRLPGREPAGLAGHAEGNARRQE